ncbi:branched-chain amino acid aminotransferase [Futiania mangrovi]|uniref:Probable branched-chain-amino-acid aminotransferase n=1 Tax=Futiania mangrovi TaxID=2959716 RepID=A0A9J6PB44_9PROT|nr:branched-chain amino acid aminotransferase [Futiania mangrovii]MCP1335350.1 branched-chain amino acid aminotransferase [Futiania mangrovii]
MVEWSRTWTWIEGGWHEGNVQIMGPRTHGMWLGSVVFDGARAFEGVAPDLDLHLERVNRSAAALKLKPFMAVGEMLELAQEGMAKFSPDEAVYIRPMYWAEEGGFFSVPPDPETTRFCLCLYEVPMPQPGRKLALTLSRYRRPTIETAPVNAKAACLYPNGARALMEAKEKGFDNAILLDAMGYVAELATANVFMVKDGEVHTPYPNGTFLNGVTRQRVIALLKAAGVTVHERPILYDEFLAADEIFSTGNYSKVVPVTQIEGRELEPGPVAAKARELYWAFAHGGL